MLPAIFTRALQLGASGRLVGPAAVQVIEVARGVLVVSIAVTAARVPGEDRDRAEPADDADGAPDRVGERCERQNFGPAGYFFSTTIVLTEALTPSATSTMTT